MAILHNDKKDIELSDNSLHVNALTSGAIHGTELLEKYETVLTTKFAIFERISEHHGRLRRESSVNSIESEFFESKSLQSYAQAASKTGGNVWAQQSNAWISNFAISFFRHNGARRDFMRHKQMLYWKQHNLDMPQDLLEAMGAQLRRDLQVPEVGSLTDSVAPIRVLDVGSCYNPLSALPTARAFDITAIDLYPVTQDVLQCDFLKLAVRPTADLVPSDKSLFVTRQVPRSAVFKQSAAETQSSCTDPMWTQLLEAPAQWFDVVTFSLVLSSLPTAEQRLRMIQKARELLILPSNSSKDPHRAGLLLIVEKDAIFDRKSPQSGGGAFAPGSEGAAGALYGLHAWKSAIAACGFRLVKYTYLRTTDGQFAHAFAFRVVSDHERSDSSQQGTSTTEAKADTQEAQLWIRQDFQRSASDEDNAYEQLSCADIVDPSVRTQKSPSSSQGRQRIVPLTSVGPSESTHINSYPVGIIGGGLGGSALALALQRAGIPAIVFEKDSSFDVRKQGYALTMQGAVAALASIGIDLDMLLQAGTGIASRSHYSYDAFGQALGVYGSQSRGGIEAQEEDKEEEDNFRGGAKSQRRHNVHVPRQRLRQMLLERLDPLTVQWNKRLESYQAVVLPQRTKDTVQSRPGAPLERAIELRFTDGSNAHCSMLVGADGIYSDVRRLMNLSPSDCAPGKHKVAGLRYLGKMCILGISPLETDVLHMSWQQTQWLDGHCRVFSMPFGDGKHMMWQMSWPMDEDAAIRLSKGPPEQVGAQLLAVALHQCRGWHAPLVTLLQRTSAINVTGHPVYDRDPLDCAALSQRDDPWSADSLKSLYEAKKSHQFVDSLLLTPGSLVTMIGDACHPMSPFKGQGANQAILDAVSLAKELSASTLSHPQRRPIPLALRSFEKEMLSRSSVKVMKSRSAAAYLHMPVALTPGDITRAMAAQLALNQATSNPSL